MFAATPKMESAIRISLIATILFNAPTLEGEMKENTMQTVHKSGQWKHLVWPASLLYRILILCLILSLLLPTSGVQAQRPVTAQAQGSTIVTVDTTSTLIDGHTSSVDALLAKPDGAGPDRVISFPEALTAVNNTGPGYTINFDLSHGATISLDSTLYLTASNTTIDGDTIKADDPHRNDGEPDVILIHLADNNVPLRIWSSNNVIRNLAIKSLDIYGSGAHDNTIVDSYIGTDVNGTEANPRLGNGVMIQNGAYHNIIENNIIAGNRSLIVNPNVGWSGVSISDAHDNEVRGNWIGLNVDGAPLANDFGVWIGNGASRNTIGGNRASTACKAPCNIISSNNGPGIVIRDAGTTSNIIRGNYIGLDITGAISVPNYSQGIQVFAGAEEITIGGYRESTACTGPCNVISGNGAEGIRLSTNVTRSVVQGNFIGLDAAGATPIPNQLAGISIVNGASDNLIGGLHTLDSDACDGPCNIISGNNGDGVLVGKGAMNNKVEGNYIGVDPAGLANMPNNTHGIWMSEGAQQNIIGGERVPTYEYKCFDSCNLIRSNAGAGVIVTGDTTRANTIRGNHIFGNGGLGIDLTSDATVTYNDSDDSDSGPNDLMNFPLGLTAAFDSNTNKSTISGVIKTMNPTTVIIDIYASEKLDRTGYGEGQLYLGKSIPDESGNFTLTIPGQLPAPFLSATATDSNGSTSEFGTRPPLIFIPGIYGSELNDGAGGDELWLGLTSFDHRRLSLFPSDQPSTEIYAPDVIRRVNIPRKPEEIYDPLLKYLTDKDLGGYREYQVNGVKDRRTTKKCDETQKIFTPTLFVFAYDWRQSNVDTAEALRDYIGCIQKFFPGSKVDILAHSMGGIVARRYIVDNKTDQQVNKLITIATPWLGAPKAIYVLATGEWGGFKESLIMTNATTKYVAGSMPGAHQLLPAQAYYNLSKYSPLFEDGWDFDNNGVSREPYSFNQYIAAINSYYGFDSQGNQGAKFVPGNNTLEFHQGLQDDWSDPNIDSNTKVNYYHLVGAQEGETTIDRVGVTYRTFCSGFSLNCFRKPTYGFKQYTTRGDGTVPLLSAERIGNGLDYNAPNAQVIRFDKELCPASIDNDLFQHTGLVSNPQVQEAVRALLSEGTIPKASCGRQERGSHTAANTSPDDQSSTVEPPPTQPYYYLTIANGTSVVISDELGNSTAPISEIFKGKVPGVETYIMGEQMELMTIPTTSTYTVTFQTTTQPIYIEFTSGTSQTATQAVRYQDLTLPSGVTAMLKITPQGAEDLRYDGDGDGTFESSITPTMSVTGDLANDLEPPTITVNVSESLLVTMTAQDSGSGVARFFYSLDGTNYQPYTAPFQITPSQNTIYAFADDNVANRATLVYPLATLIVITHVINDNGGTAAAADFTMNVTGNGPSPASFAGDESGTTVTLQAGDYSINEASPIGYVMSLSADCTGTIAIGETKTCTVTNDDISPQLIVIKHVVNDNGGTATAADFTLNVTGSSPSPASFPGNENGTTVTLQAGDYSINETGPTGYAMSPSTDCSGTIAIGETKTCTVTNDDKPPAAYTLIDLGTLGGNSTNAVAINEASQVIGYSNVAGDNNHHAFVWKNGLMTDLGTLGGSDSEAVAINEVGQVIGNSYLAGDTSSHAFVWKDGVMTDLGTLGGNWSYPVAINKAGQVIGYSYIAGDKYYHAFLWESGVMTDLGTLGGSYSTPVAINEAGQVIGNSNPVNGSLHAFVWKDGVMTDLATLGGVFSEAVAINEAGQVLVEVDLLWIGDRRAFIWEDGAMTDLGSLGDNCSSCESIPVAINEAGQVIGSSYLGYGTSYHAFVWKNGVMTDLGTLGGSNSDVRAINKTGQVIGEADLANDEHHAFLWENGVMNDLGTLGGGSRSWTVALNEAGQVIGNSYLADGISKHAFVTTPATNQNKAPTVSAGGPYSVNEGTSVTVTATSSDPEGGSLTYAFDLDNDGTFETAGQSATFSAANLDGPSNHTIQVKVTDNGGLTATDQATVNVLNVAPAVDLAIAPATVIQGEPATLTFSNPFDPSAADTAAGFRYFYDCTNDGTFELSDSAVPSYDCTYPTSGDFTAGGRIQDKDGAFADYTVQITVLPANQNQPPTVSAGGLYSVNEGALVTVTATGNDPEGEALTYAWDLDNNGSFETPGQSVSFSAAALDGPNTFTIRVQVTDNGGLTATAQATVNVLNVAPTADFTSTPSTLLAGQLATLSFSNPFDPSTADTAAGFQYSYDCTNDGTFEAQGALDTSYACPYPALGTFTALGRIADKDGGFTEYTVEVVVSAPGDPTITVNTLDSELNTDGDCSLREAIAAANANGPVDGCTADKFDTIDFSVTGTIIGTGLQPIRDALTILGPGARQLTINGNGGRVFKVNRGKTLSLQDVTITNGGSGGATSVAFGGGAIWNDRGTVSVNNVTFLANCSCSASGGNGNGGAIANGGTLTVRNSTFTKNFSPRAGGAIFNFAGTDPDTGILYQGSVVIINSTFSGNATNQRRGGAIANANGILKVISSTIAGNHAVSTGGGIDNTVLGELTLRNTIVANNTAGSSGPNCRIAGTLHDEGGNLENRTSCGFTNPASKSSANANLGPLQNNGGPTDTMALLLLPQRSDAIDIGVRDCQDLGNVTLLAYDQRGSGFPRRLDGDGNGTMICDSGAYEAGTAETPTDTPTPTNTLTPTPATNTPTDTPTPTTSTSTPTPTSISTEPVIPYLATGYRYLVVNTGQAPTGFEQPNFDDSTFPIGDAAFGSGRSCPINHNIITAWPINTDIVLRKKFTLPPGATGLKVAVAIDNDVQVFVNGVDVSGGLRLHSGCASNNSFIFSVPDSLLNSGENLVAVLGRDRGVVSYLDIQVTVAIPGSTISPTPTDAATSTNTSTPTSISTYTPTLTPTETPTATQTPTSTPTSTMTPTPTPTPVTIQSLTGNVNEMVKTGILNEGQGNALIAKLEAAVKQSEKGNAKPAINELQSFINDVNADIRSGKLTSAQGQLLIDAANAMVAALGG